MTCPISCHILDTTCGKPAANVKCEISYLGSDKDVAAKCDVKPFGFAYTNTDGRIGNWSSTGSGHAFIDDVTKDWKKFPSGIYRIRYNTKEYFMKRDGTTFFPFVDIWFEVPQIPDKHYHIPLLLSNYGYSTYRGS